MPHIVDVREEHLVQIAADIRPYDKRECEIFLGRSPREAIDFMVAKGNKAAVVEHHGRAAVLFGYNITSLLFKVAAPYLVITNYAVEHPFVFARYSGAVLDAMKGNYLVNYVQTQNDVAIKWLEWMGFYIAPPEDYQGVASVRRFSKDLR